MTSKFSIDNRELLQRISSGEAVVGIDFGNLIVRELAAFRMAAMDSEPVIIVGDDGGDALSYRRLIQSFEPGTKLYLHAQPAPVVNGEYGDAYQGAREDLAIWKRRALEAEESVRRLEQINDHLVKEAQGESRMGEPVIAQPVPVVPDEIKHRIGGLDWGWEGEFNRGWNACRAAMLHAGNSPAIPDGYVMVPKVPSQAHLNSIAMRYRHDFYLLNDAQKDSALATARQMYEECSGQGFYTLPAGPQEVR